MTWGNVIGLLTAIGVLLTGIGTVRIKLQNNRGEKQIEEVHSAVVTNGNGNEPSETEPTSAP